MTQKSNQTSIGYLHSEVQPIATVRIYGAAGYGAYIPRGQPEEKTQRGSCTHLNRARNTHQKQSL